MSRSKSKGPFVPVRLLKKVLLQEGGSQRRAIRTWARDCHIVPEFVGHTFEVHNGKDFVTVNVNENMVGHRLGEFSPTRRFRGHQKATTATET